MSAEEESAFDVYRDRVDRPSSGGERLVPATPFIVAHGSPGVYGCVLEYRI